MGVGMFSTLSAVRNLHTGSLNDIGSLSARF